MHFIQCLKLNLFKIVIKRYDEDYVYVKLKFLFKNNRINTFLKSIFSS